MSLNFHVVWLGILVTLVILYVILHCTSLILLISGQYVHLPSLWVRLFGCPV